VKSSACFVVVVANMTVEVDSGAEFEIAHVLCTDIVGYSKLMIDQQTDLLRKLSDVVRATDPFRRAEQAGKLLRIPTGDGMVLVFFTHPQDPVECAVQIARGLKVHPEIHLRTGVHSGPVSRMSDVNQQSNVAGAGINIGQRVMDCGDAGHILLSKRVAEDLAHYSKWRPHLQELGECEVKHGAKIDLFNLYTGEVGNPAPPEKFRRATQEQDAAALAADATTAAAVRRALALRRRKFTLVAGSLLAMLAVATMFWIFSQRKPATATVSSALQKAAGIASLAVKPLDNFSGDPSKNYFADGMTDELITKLSQISALKRVISRSTMMKYRQSPKSSADIARELNVEAVVEGSVVLSGDQARISVQLIEAASDKNLWTESYTRSVANIVNLQNEVALAIANAIELKLTPGEKARLASARVVNPQAYDYYLRAKNAQATEQAVDASIEMLEKAVSLDNAFADGYAELSTLYGSKGYFFDPGNNQWVIKADQAAAKALQLNPDLPAALLARAELHWRPSTGFQHDEAIVETRHALAVAPNFGEAYEQLGGFYFHVGLIEEALQQYKKADEITPDDPGIKFHFGYLALLQGRYGEACSMLAANLNGMPRGFAESTLAGALFYSGRTDEARARIDKARPQSAVDEGGILTATQALFQAAAGDKIDAHQKIDEAIKIGSGFGHFHHTTYAIASAYALMDEPEPAMKWLKYTAENGYPNLTWFERDPNLDKLRKDGRFIEFLNRLRPQFEHFKTLAASPGIPRK
jgi:TolB-like protein/class 3 adenylate cyclase/Flp pilus assembly protein TadD